MSEHIDTYVIAVTIYHPKLIPLLQKIYIIILFSSVLTKQFHNLDEQSMHNTDLTLIFLMELNVQLSKKHAIYFKNNYTYESHFCTLGICRRAVRYRCILPWIYTAQQLNQLPKWPSCWQQNVSKHEWRLLKKQFSLYAKEPHT